MASSLLKERTYSVIGSDRWLNVLLVVELEFPHVES